MYDQIKTEEYMPQKNNKKTGKLILLVLVAVLLIGIFIYLGLLLNSNSNNSNKKKTVNKKQTTAVEETVSVESPRIVTTYNYVTYGRDGINNNDYFLTNKNITVDNFENSQKIFFATQFLETDNFLDTGKTKDNKKIYAVSVEEFEAALKKFFGSVIPYDKEGTYKVSLPFTKDGGSLVNLTYDNSLKSFVSTFDTVNANNDKIKKYYTKLISAMKKGDVLTLTEKVIYTSTQPSGNNLVINIYSDYAKTKLIETKTVENSSINENTINIDNYLEKANTIEYKFDIKDSKTYYFKSSSIKN